MSNEAEYDVTSTQIFIPFKSIECSHELFYSCGCFVILSPLFPCTFVRKGDEKSAGGSRLGRLLPKIIFFSRFVTSSKTADHPGLESLINN